VAKLSVVERLERKQTEAALWLDLLACAEVVVSRSNPSSYELAKLRMAVHELKKDR